MWLLASYVMLTTSEYLAPLISDGQMMDAHGEVFFLQAIHMLIGGFALGRMLYRGAGGQGNAALKDILAK
ncbi:hypothetical protein [Hydrogenophaga sp.]|uniref:hypothetical protein n=1 Tax=Hydrogenophaga sp. TaxID=1904254 RepID=UPI002720E916|nr:hypothetical protein [Hydrogenophaga sp.]MDO9504785.1 hypothetical protein [Hydrogenophaga sp.]